MNIDNWKETKILSLFNLLLSSGDNQENKLLDGDIALISSGKFNNGVCKYIDKGDGISEKFSGNMITVDMFGQAFYQPYEFYAVSHGRVNILEPLFNMTENIGLFIATVMTKKFTDKYGMVEMCSQKALQEESIKLPYINNSINWDYIEQYIKNVKELNLKQFNIFNSLKECDGEQIDTLKWQEFKIGDIFSIVKPTVYHSHEVIENKVGIPYVVRTKFNNGIKFRVQRPTNINPSKVISFGAENSNFFYQEEEWISGRDIYYIDIQNCSKNQALFIITCLQIISSKYNYAYGLFPEQLREEKIKLPIDDNGNINYCFMDDYIEIVKKRTAIICKNLNNF